MTALNVTLLNSLAGALGADNDAETFPDALNTIAGNLIGSPQAFAVNLDALNAIAGHYVGDPQSFGNNLDALNGIIGAQSGGESSETYFPDGLRAWADQVAGGLVYTDENGIPYQDETRAFITTL